MTDDADSISPSQPDTPADGAPPSVSGLRTYDLAEVDQFRLVPDVDLIPQDPGARIAHLQLLATDATIYGLASAYQYAQLHDQAVDTSSGSFTGFNRFLHQRQLATPAFDAFKTPNVDTLYSNAWLDLTGGPVVVEVPSIAGRYYTLQFVDMYGNASNLSSRTVGERGGRFLVTTSTWQGEVPEGTRRFRVATPFMWILMRILVKDPGGDVETVRSLQDGVTITPTPGAASRTGFVSVTFDEVQHEWAPFFDAHRYVPEPGSALLFAPALFGFYAFRAKRERIHRIMKS
jgi:hypothetical protein